jgi:hypothetical protein
MMIRINVRCQGTRANKMLQFFPSKSFQLFRCNKGALDIKDRKFRKNEERKRFIYTHKVKIHFYISVEDLVSSLFTLFTLFDDALGGLSGLLSPLSQSK